MQNTGLLSRYRIGRPLVGGERERHLEQKSRLDVEPCYELSSIRLNSTYLELVDKFFAWKGLVTTIAVCLIFMASYWSSEMIWSSLSVSGRMREEWPHLIGMLLLIFLPIVLLGYWLLRKDSFAYTHYPIRLNRKTRMVHVFRLNGTVLTVPWDEVFFCIAALPQGDWEIQGHVLDADGVTVKETFPLSYYTPTSGLPVLERYWEFVRRYMEEGPEDAAHRVEFFMPVADRRESIANGFHRMHAELGGNFIMTVIGAALALMLVPGRWIAMQTSKVPKWPQEIEEACRIEPGDPWVRDATTVTPSAN